MISRVRSAGDFSAFACPSEATGLRFPDMHEALRQRGPGPAARIPASDCRMRTAETLILPEAEPFLSRIFACSHRWKRCYDVQGGGNQNNIDGLSRRRNRYSKFKIDHVTTSERRSTAARIYAIQDS